MHRAFAIGCAAGLGAAGLACGPMKPPAFDPSGLADPHYRAAESDFLSDTVAPKPSAPAAPLPPPEPPKPVVPRTPLADAACTKWTPRDLSMSVMRMPAALAARFMVPLYDAACVCSRPGDHLTVVARIIPEHGHITAATSTSWDDPTVKADPSVDACLAGVLEKSSFATFEVGSDSICEGHPELGLQPAPAEPPAGPPLTFMKPPRIVGCQGPKKTTIVYPVLVDRRAEKPAAG